MFSSRTQREEPTGHSLADELDDYLADHASRVASRHATVNSRLAALEAESAVLQQTADRHAALSS